MTSEPEIAEGVELPEEPLLRWRRIRVEGLFRRFDHDIELRADERVTIIHGRNGVGKTVTLQMINALARGDYRLLQRIPFGLLRVDFNEGEWAEIRHVDPQGLEGRSRVASGWRALNFQGKTPEELLREKLGAVRVQPHGLGDAWIHSPSKRVLSTREVIREFFRGKDPRKDVQVTDPIWPLQVRLRTLFIETQRLFRIRAVPHLGSQLPSPEEMVVALAQDLARRITAADEEYTQISLRLDSSLPQRLFAMGTPKSLSDLELRERTGALERERGRLQRLGLIESDSHFDPSGLDDAKRAMFAVYLEDNEKKLGVFRDLADRAELLLQAMNTKLAPTVLKVSKQRGYMAFAHDGQELGLELLSSGEKHELVLLHNLLFNVRPESLVLIDEPELSLHVTWQQEFLDDLLQIAQKAKFDALVATHSPYIVGKHRELMVELRDPS